MNCEAIHLPFDSSLQLREAHKPVFAAAICDLLGPVVPANIPNDGIQYVLDGGALLQRIPSSRGSTYRDICHLHTDYVTKKYGDAIVLFDGYESTNTKDITHLRRSKGNAGITVTFTADMNLTMKKELFLSNRQNKQRFIFMLSEELQKNNCETYHASGDADLLIVQKTVQSANVTNTVLVGDDTDLLVLLCYYASLEAHDLFFCPEPKKNIKKPCIWNIKATNKMLGTDIRNHILFLHAVLGCDTTSRLHGIRKGASLKKFKENNSFREQAKVSDTYPASVCDVAFAGEKALVITYNGKSTDILDRRYHRHQK